MYCERTVHRQSMQSYMIPLSAAHLFSVGLEGKLEDMPEPPMSLSPRQQHKSKIIVEDEQKSKAHVFGKN